MIKEPTFFHTLPIELKINIFKEVPLKDLNSCMRVSKLWFKYIQETSEIWENLSKQLSRETRMLLSYQPIEKGISPKDRFKKEISFQNYFKVYTAKAICIC